MAEKHLIFKDQNQASAIYGSLDSNIYYLEKEFTVNITGRDLLLTISGSEASVDKAARAIEAMQRMYETNGSLDDQSVRYCTNLVRDDEDKMLANLEASSILITSRGKPIKPKTLGQKQYVDAITNNFIVFGVGPAGTGKTYLAVTMAVKALKNHDVSRIILTRPAVEAGEKLGFLPGDLQNKVDPYLRPLYDALFDTMGQESFQKNLDKGIIEVAPLAYMRGRTLDDAFVILDEAQNTTPEQMKMFLTRLGSGSKMVVNGDITQIDLPDKGKSGLIEALRVLDGLDGIEMVRFSEKDVVRFRLVAQIVKAYDKYNSARNGGKNNGK